MVRQDSQKARAQILRALFEAQVRNKVEGQDLLNKHQLEKHSHVRGRQTVYNNIALLQTLGWIKINESTLWKTKQKSRDQRDRMERYELTDQGLYAAVLCNPDLESKAKGSLGFDFRRFKADLNPHKVAVEGGLRRLQRYFELIDRVVQNGAPPTWYMTMKFLADHEGRVGFRVHIGTEELDRELKTTKAKEAATG